MHLRNAEISMSWIGNDCGGVDKRDSLFLLYNEIKNGRHYEDRVFGP